MSTPLLSTTPSFPRAPSQATGSRPGGALRPSTSGCRVIGRKTGRPWLSSRAGAAVLHLAGRGGTISQSRRSRACGSDFAMATHPGELKAFAAAHPTASSAGSRSSCSPTQDAKAGRRTAAVSDSNAVPRPPEGRAAGGPRPARPGHGEDPIGRQEPGRGRPAPLADDAHQFQAVRAEALYQFASLAASANRGDEVQRLAAQLLQIDPQSPWAQRAFALEAEVPPPAVRTPLPPCSPSPR